MDYKAMAALFIAGLLIGSLAGKPVFIHLEEAERKSLEKEYGKQVTAAQKACLKEKKKCCKGSVKATKS